MKVTNGVQETLSDEEGYFSLECPPGAHRLSLSKEGFATTTIAVTLEDTTVNTGTIVLLQSEYIVTIEEVEGYVSQEKYIAYYTGKGFKELGTIRVEYTEGMPLYVTTLITSTQSVFVLEDEGATGVLFDFSTRTKEIYMGEFVLTAPFGGDEWRGFAEGLWSSQEIGKEIEDKFAELLKEEPELVEFVEMIGTIEEDTVSPAVLQNAYESSGEAPPGESFLTVKSSVVHRSAFLTSLGLDAHRYTARESTNSVTVKTAQTAQTLLQEDLAFISTIIYGLRGVITWPKGINFAIALPTRKRVARAYKKALEEVQGPLEDGKKNWENLKKKLEDSKKALEDSKKNLEDSKKGLEDSKKKLEDIKREYENRRGEGCRDQKLYEKEIKDLEKEIKELEDAIKKCEDSIKEVEKGIEGAKKSIESCEEEIRKRADLLEQIEAWKGIMDIIIKDC